MTTLHSRNDIRLCDKCRSEIRGENTYASTVLYDEPFDGTRVYFTFHPGCNPTPDWVGVMQRYSWDIDEHVHDNAFEAKREKHDGLTA